MRRELLLVFDKLRESPSRRDCTLGMTYKVGKVDATAMLPSQRSDTALYATRNLEGVCVLVEALWPFCRITQWCITAV